LDGFAVEVLLHVLHAHHVVVHVPPHLEQLVCGVRGEAVLADVAVAAGEAEVVTLALLDARVHHARVKELRPQQRLQPSAGGEKGQSSDICRRQFK
jgi:hypothetical protein